MTFILALYAGGVTMQDTPARVALFSSQERAAIVAYWTTPGRYEVGAPPDAATKGP